MKPWEVSYMKKNVGQTDKIVRYILAPLLVVGGILIFSNITWLAIVMFLLALILVVTSIVGLCPLYMLFGINTCKINTEEK